MADKDVKRHPIRGALWGILMGIGVYLLLGGMKVIAFGESGMFAIILAISVVANVLWGLFGPAKAAKPPKGWTPAEPAPAVAFADTWTPPEPPTVPDVPAFEASAPPEPPAEGGSPA
jgi:hypothetical protein